MSFFTQIGSDLAEKRLVPVVALLVVAIIALPIVVGGSSSSPAAPLPVPVSVPPGTSPLLTSQVQSLIASMSPDAGAVHSNGSLHDPFLLSPTPATAATTKASTTSAASGTTTSTTSTTTSSTPASSGTTTPATTHTTTCSCPKRTTQGTIYSVALQFGQAASVHRVTAPVRLAPFPSQQNPQIAYLGVRKGGGSVMFLVSKGAIAAGDGSCQPNANNCQVVTMKPGDTEYFDVTTPTQGLVQYELDLVSISSHRTHTRASAVHVNRLVSATGLAFARRVNSSVVNKLSFSLVDGVLIPATSTSKGVTAGKASLSTAAIPTGAAAGIFARPRSAFALTAKPPAVIQQPGPGGAPAADALTLPAA